MDASFAEVISTSVLGRSKWPGNEAFFAAIFVRKSGAVNSQRFGPRFPDNPGGYWPIVRQSRVPISAP